MDNQNYNYQNYQNYQNYRPPMDRRSHTLETLSLSLGVIALCTCVCVYPSIVLGALGIILAALSKGGELTLSSKGKAAMSLNIVALSLTIVLIAISFAVSYVIFGGFDNMLKAYEQMQGMSYDEIYQMMYQQMFPQM